MKFWTRPEAVNQTAFAVDLSSRVLTHFEEYFNIPYPLAKMGKYSQAIKLCWLDVYVCRIQIVCMYFFQIFTLQTLII